MRQAADELAVAAVAVGARAAAIGAVPVGSVRTSRSRVTFQTTWACPPLGGAARRLAEDVDEQAAGQVGGSAPGIAPRKAVGGMAHDVAQHAEGAPVVVLDGDHRTALAPAAPVAHECSLPPATAAAYADVLADLTVALGGDRLSPWLGLDPNVDAAGRLIPNHATLALGTGGSFDLCFSAAARLVADVTGWYLAQRVDPEVLPGRALTLFVPSTQGPHQMLRA